MLQLAGLELLIKGRAELKQSPSGGLSRSEPVKPRPTPRVRTGSISYQRFLAGGLAGEPVQGRNLAKCPVIKPRGPSGGNACLIKAGY